MSAQDIKSLKEKIQELEDELRLKHREVETYQRELVKFSNNLDLILNASRQDVSMLNQLHKTMVPTDLPEFPGFSMSRKFAYGTKHGGDYFDIFPSNDKMKFGILLASSSSYAMSATFLSVLLQQTDILEGRKKATVTEIVKTLGEELKKIAPAQEQTQLFYAVIDRRHMTMSFSCIGQIAGLIQAPDELLKIISSDREGINQNAKSEYTSLEIDLKPGYRICLLSEGLLQVLDQDELVAVAEETASGSVHELRNQMFIQAQMKSGLEQPLKDQTVIVIEVKDNIVKLAKK